MDTLAQVKSCDFSKKAMLIINPVSGKKLVLKHISQIIRTLMDAGYMVTTMVTSSRGEAKEFAQKHGREYDLVCCTGGDGTLNETLSGLAAGGIDVPLGYIPCGSTNDFARSHKLATDIVLAAENIASGRTTRYDIGSFGDHFFSYVAAFGAFSWLSYTTDQNKKNVLGHTAYIIDGIKDLPKLKPIHVKITADGAVYEDDYIFGAVCNSYSIAGTITLPSSIVDTCDGKLEVLLIKVPKTLIEFQQVLHALLVQDYSSPFIELFQAEDIYVENPPGLEWSLDGECPGPYDNVHIRPIPGFLNLQG